MTCFFSGTDMQELHDNAGSHNYYLSLIVNHNSQYCAKIAFVAQRTIKTSKEMDFLTFKGTDGEDEVMDLSSTAKGDKIEEVLVTLDCDIVFEQDDFLVKRIEELKKPKPITTNYNNYSNGKPYYEGYGGHKSPYVNYPEKTTSGFKTYGNMSQKERKEFQKLQNERNKQYSLDEGDDWGYGVEYNKNTPGTFDSLDIQNFLVKWISGDNLCEDKLTVVLKKFEKDGDTYMKLKDSLTKLEDKFNSVFAYVFVCDKTDITFKDKELLSEKCITKLQSLEDDFKVCGDIIDILHDNLTDDMIEKNSTWNKLKK